MKIAFFLNDFPLLSETFILNQVTGLIDRGHQVDIYARRLKKHTVAHEDVARYKLLDRTFCHEEFSPKMPSNKSIRFLKVPALFLANLDRPSPLIKSLNVFKLGREAASNCSIYKYLAFLGKGMHTYDIVHCHFGPNGNLGAFLKYVGITKGKLLTTFYGYDVSSYVKRRGESAYKFLFKQCDMTLCLSHTMKNQLIQLGCSRQKINIHRLGAAMSVFSFLPRYRKADGRIDLFTPARLVEKKGLEYAIRAVAMLVRKYPKLEYRIAGGGYLKKDLENLIRELGVGKRIKLLGWKRQEEIIELLKNADILLAPSVTAKDGDQEGTPTVLIEALAQGLPVLSTNHSGIPEVVEDGKSGFLVPEKDADALAEKLACLIEHPEIWPEMGKAGRTYVEQHYDIDKLNDRLVLLYQQLLEDGKSIGTNTASTQNNG